MDGTADQAKVGPSHHLRRGSHRHLDRIAAGPHHRDCEHQAVRRGRRLIKLEPRRSRALLHCYTADKELSALLARDLLVPIVHDKTREALCEVSPLPGSRSGVSIAEGPMADVAAEPAELFSLSLNGHPAACMFSIRYDFIQIRS